MNCVGMACLNQPKQEQGEPVPMQEPTIAACINGADAIGNKIDGQEAAKVYAAMQRAMRFEKSPQPKQEQGEPVAMAQVYHCKIKSRKKIDREIPREKQGWWADISAGQLIRLRQATQADVDRCTLNGAHSKDPADYMCETHTNGSLVSKVALEYMNPEQNVFASTTPQQRKPMFKTEDLKHKYNPHKKYPWFCADCGYAEHEFLMHTAAHGIKE